MAALFPEHTWIIAERLRRSHDDTLVVGGRGIDQPVVFVGREYGGNQEQTILSSSREFITQPNEFGAIRL